MLPDRSRRLRALAAALLLLLALLTGCGGGGDDGASTDTTVADTSNHDDGTADPDDADAGDEDTDGADDTDDDTAAGADWEFADPADEGFDPEALEAVRETAFAEDFHTQGIVIIRNDRIVAEWYADDADETSWAASWSMAKSITSALVGIAIDEGLIEGVDEPLTTWFPEWEERGFDDITLEHVLHMEDGLDWDESYDPGAGVSDVITLVTTGDPPIDHVLGLDRAAEPGTRFNYSSGTTLLLSEILQQATGMPADEYATEKLFEPLGFSRVDWWRGVDGRTLTYCCVDTTTRDFARVGLLYLHDGRLGDEQIVPESWVRDSLTPSDASEGHYGHQWWLTPDGGDLPGDTFAMRGHDGQFVHVIPSLDLVIARNGTYVKDPGEPVADPTLFSVYPPSGLSPGKGTTPPVGWDQDAFVGSIIDAIVDP